MKQGEAKKEFQISSDLSRVQKTSAEVLNFLKPLTLSGGAAFDIRLCLEEALINAIKYGNALNKNLKVRLGVSYGKGRVKISVEDEGPGFDPGRVKDCTRGENLVRNCGRGVYLMRQLMDEVKYSPKGNRVEMVKYLKEGAWRSSRLKKTAS